MTEQGRFEILSDRDLLEDYIVGPSDRQSMSSVLDEIEATKESMCQHCGGCCTEDGYLNLHEYEAPRIASLLLRRGGVELVRSRILFRPVAFNVVTPYLLAMNRRCLLFQQGHCSIHAEQQLACRLWPMYLEAFQDRPGDAPQVPVVRLHHQNGAPCREKIARINDLVKTFQSKNAWVIRGMLWDTIQSRPGDLAFLFARPSEETGSDRFIDFTGIPAVEGCIDQVGARATVTYIRVLNSLPLVASVGLPGARLLTEQEARTLASADSVKSAEKKALEELNGLVRLCYASMLEEKITTRGSHIESA